jgi:hypothetical protein
MGANAQTAVPVFTAGQVLTAQQQTEINTGIPVFATTVTRDAAFGGAGEKTLAEGQFAYIEATDTTQYYDGAAWQSVGSTSAVVQVKSGTLTTTASTSSTTYVDTGITVTITPTSASNKIFISAMVCLGLSSGNHNTNIALLRDSTNLIVPTSPSARRPSINMLTGNISANIVDNMLTIPITFLDSPATTSATVYKVQYLITGGTALINRTSTDTDNSAFARGVSTITVMEVTP